MSSRFAAVIGCGPAGLLAAEALGRRGFNVSIYSRREPSKISGAQYLHCAIPGITNENPDFQLKFVKLGERSGYAHKVYGSVDAPCSWDEFPDGYVDAWSMATAYGVLWHKWAPRIADVEIEGTDFVRRLVESHEVVVCTIPAPVLCIDPSHKFESQKVWIAEGERPGVGQNTIVYSGRMSDWWYRTSLIAGRGSTEAGVPLVGAQMGRKPLDTDCTCMPEVVRAGRFGQWKKGVLVHHVWEQIHALYPV